MESIVDAMEENPDREDIIKVGKDYTTEDAVIVIEKSTKAIEPETISSCWRSLCSDVVRDFTGFTTEPIKEIMKEVVTMAKKAEGRRVSRYGSRRNSRANRRTTRGMNRRKLDGDESFRTSLGNKEEDVEESVTVGIPWGSSVRTPHSHC